MKKLLNTLFVTRDGVYLAKDGECIAVKESREGQAEPQILIRVPIHTLESVVCFGRVAASPAVMGFCGDNRVLISFLTGSGRFLARCQGRSAGNILLRKQQYRISDDIAASASIARSIVAGKVANCRVTLQRAARDKSDSDADTRLAEGIAKLGRIVERLERNPGGDLDRLRGVEGEAAACYFDVFGEMVVASQRDAFAFRGRSRRPPMDRINALLSFVYTLLTHDCVAALEGVGLDAYSGFLHRDRPGRPGLALDLMEELRPVLADRLVLTLINRQQLKAGDFEIRDNGAVSMKDHARKEVLRAWQERKREEVIHPVIDERAAIGLFPHIQALLLARHIRGDLAGYPSLLWR